MCRLFIIYLRQDTSSAIGNQRCGTVLANSVRFVVKSCCLHQVRYWAHTARDAAGWVLP